MQTVMETEPSQQPPPWKGTTPHYKGTLLPNLHGYKPWPVFGHSKPVERGPSRVGRHYWKFLPVSLGENRPFQKHWARGSLFSKVGNVTGALAVTTCPHVAFPRPSGCGCLQVQGELKKMKEANKPTSEGAAHHGLLREKVQVLQCVSLEMKGKFPLSSVISFFQSCLTHLPTLILTVMNFASFRAQ